MAMTMTGTVTQTPPAYHLLSSEVQRLLGLRGWVYRSCRWRKLDPAGHQIALSGSEIWRGDVEGVQAEIDREQANGTD
jgi:hypothetical protein